MQLCIPNVGDHLQLNCDWDIGIHSDIGNRAMFKYLEMPFSWSMINLPSTPVTIPKGAVLKIEQIYIRKGSADLSSLKFLWRNPPTGKSIRFQVMLDDVNRMDCEFLVI